VNGIYKKGDISLGLGKREKENGSQRKRNEMTRDLNRK
jgi:hypothetical protein